MRIQIFLASWGTLVAGSDISVNGRGSGPSTQTETIHRTSRDALGSISGGADNRKRLLNGHAENASISSAATSHLRAVKKSGGETYGATEYSAHSYGGSGKGTKNGGHHGEDGYYYEGQMSLPTGYSGHSYGGKGKGGQNGGYYNEDEYHYEGEMSLATGYNGHYYGGSGKGAKSGGYYDEDDFYYEGETSVPTGYSGHSYGGKGKGGKKGGYYDEDDYHYEDQYFSVEDIGNETWYPQEGYAYGKGTKSGKRSKGAKGSKKGSSYKNEKKKFKSDKKEIDKKLKRSEDYGDDSNSWDFDWNDGWSDTPAPTATSIPGDFQSQSPVSSMVGDETQPPAGSPTPLDVFQPPVPSVVGGETQTSTVSPTPLDEFNFTSRMDGDPFEFEGDSSFVIQVEETIPDTAEDVVDTSRTHISTFQAPRVERELFPDGLQLKAHSTTHLQQHDSVLFAQTTTFMTPCLQRAYTDHLEAYKLTVDYSDGPDASDAGVIITYMNLHVVVSVVTETIDALRLLTHESATKAVHECFDGPQMYAYLGSLRRQGVEVNEIAFIDKPFRSPVFGNNQAASIVKSSQGDSTPFPEPKNSHAGLIATMTVGMVVVGAILLAHRRGKLPAVEIPTDRLGHLGASIRNSVSKFRLPRGKMNSFGSSNQVVNGSDDPESSSSSSDGMRVRTWSGSFRRHPPGGVKPAALQKKPAFSQDFLKSPRADDYSFSVGGDYNVPDEYDFQATPMSEIYGGRHKRPPSAEDEFSMPDDYNTVHEDMSHYSKNVRTLASTQLTPASRVAQHHGARATPSSVRKHPPGYRPNPFVSPTRSAPGSASDLQSPLEPSFVDEWSMNSFTTGSPAGTNSQEASSPPYRHWNDRRPSDSPGSKLAMPRLS